MGLLGVCWLLVPSARDGVGAEADEGRPPLSMPARASLLPVAVPRLRERTGPVSSPHLDRAKGRFPDARRASDPPPSLSRFLASIGSFQPRGRSSAL